MNIPGDQFDVSDYKPRIATNFQMGGGTVTPQGTRAANPYYAGDDAWGDLANFGRAGQKTLSSLLGRASKALGGDKAAFYKERNMGRYMPEHGLDAYVEKSAVVDPGQWYKNRQMAMEANNPANSGVAKAIGFAKNMFKGKPAAPAPASKPAPAPAPAPNAAPAPMPKAASLTPEQDYLRKNADFAQYLMETGYLDKSAFQPMMGGAPADPMAGGGMPPGMDPAMMGMDPSMMGGDPAMMGMDPSMAGGAPMDPAMAAQPGMGGMLEGGPVDPNAIANLPPAPGAGGEPAPGAGGDGMALSPEIQEAITQAVNDAVSNANNGGGNGNGGGGGSKGPSKDEMMMGMVSKLMDAVIDKSKGPAAEAQPAAGPTPDPEQVT